MKALRLISVAVFGIAFVFAWSAMAAAQGTKKSSDLLTPRQVKELVATAKTPADHLKLSKHFAALAAKYEAEVADHDAVAAAYRKNPTASESKRPGAPDTALHCDRLAIAARTAAKEARELSAAHAHMAKEGPVAKASRLTDEELVALIEPARTPADHETLAAYYDQIARTFEGKAIEHRKLASIYRNRTVPIFPKIPTPISYATYYDGLAARAWRSATEANLMAGHHRMLAAAAGSAPKR